MRGWESWRNAPSFLEASPLLIGWGARQLFTHSPPPHTHKSQTAKVFLRVGKMLAVCGRSRK